MGPLLHVRMDLKSAVTLGWGQSFMADQHQPAIEALFAEGRTFPPPENFIAQANVRDPNIYARAASDYSK